MSGIPRVDMGESFPLRRSERPYARAVVWWLAGFTLFGFLPLAYMADTGQWRAPSLWLAVAVGVVCFLAMIVAIRTRTRWEIDGNTVRLTMRHLLRTRTQEEPLASYRALVTVPAPEPGFLRPRMVFLVVLRHREDSVRSVPLFVTHRRELFEKRLARYQALFGLPVDSL